MLAASGALDLSLAKLFEGHTDALAILVRWRISVRSTLRWPVAPQRCVRPQRGSTRTPVATAQRAALRVRSVVEAAAATVMQHAGRAVGAGPLCRNTRFAQAMADLPVYLRQSHAERDLAALATLLKQDNAPWSL